MNISKTSRTAAMLAAATLTTGAHGSIIDSDTLVYVSADIAPAANAEMNDLRAAGDTSKPSLKLTYSTQPTRVEDSALPTLYAGHYYDAEKTVNTNVLKVNGKMLMEMTDRSYLDGSFTAEFFFRTENNGVDGLVANSGSNSDAYLIQQHANWYFRIHTDGNNSGKVTFNDSKGDNYTTVSLADGKWHHFAVVWDKPTSTIRGYIDYKLHKETDLSAAPLPKTSTYLNLNIGRGVWGDGHRLASGRYDGIRITKRALTPAEFLSPSVLPIDGDTLAYMSFDSYAAAQSGQYDIPLGTNALSCALRKKDTSYGTNETVIAPLLYPCASAVCPFADTRSISATITEIGNGSAGFGYVFADPGHLVGTTNFTAEVFAKFTAAPSPNYGYVFYQPNVWRLFLTTQGRLGCSVKGMTQNKTGEDSLIDDQWHHLAAVYDSARQTFSYYLDYGLFCRFENVQNPIADGASNPEKLLFGGNSHDSYNMQGSVNGVLYDELRITKRALKVAEFLTDTSIAGVDPVFFARYESDFEGMAAGRYAVTGEVSAAGAELAASARSSREILNANKETLFANAKGLDLLGGTVAYTGNGAFDLNAATAEFFVRKLGGGAANNVVSFGATGAANPVWSLSAGGAFVFRTASDSLEASLAIGDGQFHHVAVAYAPSGADTAVTVSLDHTAVASGTLTGAIDFGSGAGFTVGSAGFTGAIDELRLREGARGVSEMLHASPPPATFMVFR